MFGALREAWGTLPSLCKWTLRIWNLGGLCLHLVIELYYSFPEPRDSSCCALRSLVIVTNSCCAWATLLRRKEMACIEFAFHVPTLEELAEGKNDVNLGILRTVPGDKTKRSLRYICSELPICILVEWYFWYRNFHFSICSVFIFLKIQNSVSKNKRNFCKFLCCVICKHLYFLAHLDLKIEVV